MNIQTLLGSSAGLANSSANSSTTSGTSTSSAQASAVSAASTGVLGKAGQRIQSDVDATRAQLSKFGLLKSALADAQQSAKALSGLSAASTNSEVTGAMGSFFKTFNTSVTAAITAATAGSALSSSQARRVVQDLKAALRADPATSAAMKKLGLSVQSDGTLAQDAKQFANALGADASGVRAAMALVGKKVDSALGQELASNGTVGAALSNLNQRSTVLTAQQSAMKSLQQAMAAYQANTST